MFPYPKRATVPPEISNHVGPFEKIDPEVPIPLINEF